MEEVGWRHIDFGGGILLTLIPIIWPHLSPFIIGIFLLLALALFVDGTWRVVMHRRAGREAVPESATIAGGHNAPAKGYPEMSDAELGRAMVLLSQHFRMEGEKTVTSGRFLSAQHMYAEGFSIIDEMKRRGYLKAAIRLNNGNVVANFNALSSYLAQLGTLLANGQRERSAQFAEVHPFSVNGIPKHPS